MELNSLYNEDCMKFMKKIDDNFVNLTLTDIPYGEVNRDSGGLRKLDKENADIMTFDLQEFLNEIYRITQGTIIIFCGNEQYGEIYNYFANKKGTVRQLIWQKSNPSPMNGQYIYLSGTENAVWFKKPGSTFNANCKTNVFKFPNGSSKLHPTEKNHDLIKELILDNSNPNDILFDPCSGSGSHLYNAKILNRRFIGTELQEKYFKISLERLNNVNNDIDNYL